MIFLVNQIRNALEVCTISKVTARVLPRTMKAPEWSHICSSLCVEIMNDFVGLSSINMYGYHATELLMHCRSFIKQRYQLMLRNEVQPFYRIMPEGDLNFCLKVEETNENVQPGLVLAQHAMVVCDRIS